MDRLRTQVDPAVGSSPEAPGTGWVPEPPRRSFFRRVAATAAVVPATWALTSPRRASAAVATLPNLYAGWNLRNFQSIQNHENAHVGYLQAALGSSSFPMPAFNTAALTPANVLAFAQLAQVFENTGTGAYLAAAPLIFSQAYLAAAGSIFSVEARHSGYLNTLLNTPITYSTAPGVNNAFPGEQFETPIAPAQVAQMVAPFFVDPTVPASLANAISGTRSAANDVAILRFALGLEYLEAAFYNINVPRFS